MNKYDEMSPASNWLAKLEIMEMLIKYYSKKFKNSCIFEFQRLKWYTYVYNDVKKDYDFTPIVITHTFLEDKYDTILIQKIKLNIITVVSNISKCIKEKGKKVTIAILFPYYFLEHGKPFAHENVLIFKPYYNKMEWFEPHGENFLTINENVTTSNTILLRYFIGCLEEDKIINCEDIKLVKPPDICPGLGLQFKEERSKLLDLSGGGYCALWSILITKLSLKYPYKPLKMIVNNLLEQYKDPDQYKESDQLRKLMYAFSNEVSDILLKHYKMSLNEMIVRLNNNEIIPVKSIQSTSASSQSY